MRDFLLELERVLVCYLLDQIDQGPDEEEEAFIWNLTDIRFRMRFSEADTEEGGVGGESFHHRGEEGHLIILEMPKTNMAGKGVWCWPHWGDLTM